GDVSRPRDARSRRDRRSAAAEPVLGSLANRGWACAGGLVADGRGARPDAAAVRADAVSEDLVHAISLSLRVSLAGTILAALIGIPAGAWLGSSTFRGRRV